MVIYKITNLVNNKIYIGKNLHNNPNYLGSGFLIKRAIKKYGKENFRKEIIEVCDKEKANEREIYWIKKLSSTDLKTGYNITEGGMGGDNFSNNPRKEEIRQGMKERFTGEKNPMFGKPWPEERKERVRLKLLGKKASEETKLKISISSKGENNSMFGVCGDKHHNFGKILTLEQKEKLSESLLEYWNNNDQRKKDISGENSITKRPEVKKKMSESRKGRILSIRHKEKISKALRGRKGVNLGKRFSEEVKKKNSEAQKLRFSKMTAEEKLNFIIQRKKQKLDQKVVDSRIEVIKSTDKTKLGWVKELSGIINIGHGPLRRFIKKYCPMELEGAYKRS